MAYKKPKLLELPATIKSAKPTKPGKQKKKSKKLFESVLDASFDRTLEDPASDRNANTLRTSLANLKGKHLGKSSEGETHSNRHIPCYAKL